MPLTTKPFRTALCRTALFLGATTALLLTACTAVTPLTAVPPLATERITQIIASPDRTAADRATDVRRKPDQILAFIGVKPGMTVLDLSAGGGYTTELLARAVGPTGRVYGQSAPRPAAGTPARPAVTPEGAAAPALPVAPAATAVSAAAANVAAPPAAPRPTSPQALATRAQNPAVSHIVSVVQPFEDPVPKEVASAGLDVVTLMFNYHDLGHMGVDRARMNKAIFAALKPGGVYVLSDHAGRPGTGLTESGTLHRIEEAFLIQEIEASGLKLIARGDFIRNPADPRDKNTPNPPMAKDGFVVRFVKP